MPLLMYWSVANPAFATLPACTGVICSAVCVKVGAREITRLLPEDCWRLLIALKDKRCSLPASRMQQVTPSKTR